MDRKANTDVAYNWPGPGHCYRHRWGFPNVVADRNGRYITSSVPAECGPILAAGPTLLRALDKIVTMTVPGSPAHETAVSAIESFREGEAMTLVDWRSDAPAPRLRIVGVAV